MTYSYICTSCGHEWEAQQRISEPPLQTCEKCAEPSAKRQIAGPANFILKGGGWYSDLYSSSSGKNGEKSAKADSTEKKADKAESTTNGAADKKSDSASTSSTASASTSTSTSSATST
jgi:putative FmdB family regulatory protein